MILFILSCIVALVGWAGWATWLSQRNRDGAQAESAARGGMIIGIVCFLLAFVMLFGSMVRTVGTKEVGIETAFGHVNGELSNGFHLTAPWVNVNEMDGAIQTDSYEGTSAMRVRIANQQTANVDVTVQWRIDPTAAGALFQNYRSFDNIRNAVVTRWLRQALNAQLADYNPLSGLGELGAPSYGKNPSLATIANRVQHQLTGDVDQNVLILNVIIPYISYDPQTEARLAQAQQQVASTRVAELAQQTAAAQNKANQALAASVNNNPGVLESRCLDIMETLVKRGGTPPIGMCNLTGSSVSGVIANSGASK